MESSRWLHQKSPTGWSYLWANGSHWWSWEEFSWRTSVGFVTKFALGIGLLKLRLRQLAPEEAIMGECRASIEQYFIQAKQGLDDWKTNQSCELSLYEATWMIEKAMSTLHISSLHQLENTMERRSLFPIEEGALLYHMSRLHLQWDESRLQNSWPYSMCHFHEATQPWYCKEAYPQTKWWRW